MTTFKLKRNAADEAVFELWSADERYLVAIIHEDMLLPFKKNYAELVLVEEETSAKTPCKGCIWSASHHIMGHGCHHIMGHGCLKTSTVTEGK